MRSTGTAACGQALRAARTAGLKLRLLCPPVLHPLSWLALVSLLAHDDLSSEIRGRVPPPEHRSRTCSCQ